MQRHWIFLVGFFGRQIIWEAGPGFFWAGRHARDLGMRVMKQSSSRKLTLKNAVAITALVLLGACSSTAQVAETNANSMNLYGPETDQATRSRVDRLTKYCKKLSSAKDLNLANGLCLRAHDLDPTNPLPLVLLASNFQIAGDDERAIEAYSKVLEHHPDNAEVSYRLGKLLAALGREQEAMDTLLAGLEHNPDEPRLMNVVGILKDQEGDHSTAQFYYRESLEADPGNVSVENNLGLSLALSGQAEEAVALLENVVARPDADEVSHRNLELAYKAAAEQSPAADAAQSPAPDGQIESSKAPTVLSPLNTLTSYIEDTFSGEQTAERDILADSVQVAAAPEVPSMEKSTDAVDWDQSFGVSVEPAESGPWQNYTPGGRIQNNTL